MVATSATDSAQRSFHLVGSAGRRYLVTPMLLPSSENKDHQGQYIFVLMRKSFLSDSRGVDLCQNVSLPQEVHIAVPSQEAEVSDKIEMRRAKFHARQLDNLGKASMSVTPIKGRRGNTLPCP